MEEVTNAIVQKLVHKALDPVMKKEGFKRKNRTYYKKSDEMIFVLTTKAVGAYFSSVTHWPSHAFSVFDGVWIDGITPGKVNGYPTKTDKEGTYIPEFYTCLHLSGDDLAYAIHRKEQHPYLESAARYGVNSEAEKKRNNLWVMPDDTKEQQLFLQELQEQIQTCFLDECRKCGDIDFLKKLVLDKRLEYNRNRGYEDGMAFSAKSFVGNFQGYLEYAVLFHQRYGSEEEYRYYLQKFEEWSALHNRSINSCCYCGFGNEFKL